MDFKVEVTEPSEADIDEAAAYIALDSPSSAQKWNRELWELIFSLRKMPARFSIITEAKALGFPYRSALHYSHRVIFRIDEAAQTVFVVRVYHGARMPLDSEDVTPPQKMGPCAEA